MKRQPTEQEKMSASHISDKGLISKIYKLIQLNSKKTWTMQFLKWAKYLNRHFPKRAYRWRTGTWKDTLHHYQGNANQTTMRPHPTLVRMAVIKKTRNKRWRGCRGKGIFVHGWGECKLGQSYEKQHKDSSKN